MTSLSETAFHHGRSSDASALQSHKCASVNSIMLWQNPQPQRACHANQRWTAMKPPLCHARRRQLAGHCGAGRCVAAVTCTLLALREAPLPTAAACIAAAMNINQVCKDCFAQVVSSIESAAGLSSHIAWFACPVSCQRRQECQQQSPIGLRPTGLCAEWAMSI